MENPFDDTYFMKKAMQEAEIAFENGEVPVGAVIVVNNRIIGRAHNLTERLKDVTLEPCQMCAGGLYWSQISRVVYGASDLERGFSVMGGHLHPKTEVVGGVMENESAELLKRFFIQRRNLN